jgi:hypothetical protein
MNCGDAYCHDSLLSRHRAGRGVQWLAVPPEIPGQEVIQCTT